MGKLNCQSKHGLPPNRKCLLPLSSYNSKSLFQRIQVHELPSSHSLHGMSALIGLADNADTPSESLQEKRR